MTKHHHPLSVAAAVIGGAFRVLQAKLNGLLGIEIGNGVLAAEVSFGSGLILISLIMIARKGTIQEIANLKRAVRNGELPIWALFAGSIGGFFVITQGLTAGLLGISIFTLSVVTGQAIAAVIIDTFGLIGIQSRKLNLARGLGALIATVGLFVANFQPGSVVSPLLLMPLIAGFGIGFQQAMNGNIGKASQSPLLATWINFAVGVIFIALVLLFRLDGVSEISWPTNPILYLGGTIGVIFIFMQVIVVRIIGVLAMGISLLFGQLAASFILDLLVPSGHNPLEISSILGLALVGVGALMVIRKKVSA